MKRRIALALLIIPVLVFFTACFPFDSGGTQHKLIVTVKGEGSVSPSHSLYKRGALVVFNVFPAPGWSLSHWEGVNGFDVRSNGDRWDLIMDGDKNLVAVFEEGTGNPDPSKQYNLVVQINGKGKVTPDSGKFAAGSKVTLTITETDRNYAFIQWEGRDAADVIIENGVHSIIMDSNKELEARFYCAK